METIVINKIKTIDNKKYEKFLKRVLTKQILFTIIKTTKQVRQK